MHSHLSGVIHKTFHNDIHALQSLRHFMNFLPQAWNQPKPPAYWSEEDEKHHPCSSMLNNIVPLDPKKPYDMKAIIASIADRNYFYELKENHAPNIITCFA